MLETVSSRDRRVESVWGQVLRGATNSLNNSIMQLPAVIGTTLPYLQPRPSFLTRPDFSSLVCSVHEYRTSRRRPSGLPRMICQHFARFFLCPVFIHDIISLNMLTQGQKDYLSKLNPEMANSSVHVESYNPHTKLVAEEVINTIKGQIPEADVRFIGASALGISGLNDVDIYVICPVELKESYLSKLEDLFGEQIKNQWQWMKNGFEVSVYLSDPEDKSFKEQIKIFNILKNNPKILKEYKDLKHSMSGKSYKEYQMAKYEFYNMILDIEAKN